MIRYTASTDNIEYVVLSTPGGVEATGLTLTDLTVGYIRDGAAAVEASATALASATAAHSDCGMFEIGNGVHRVDVPDAAYLTGSNKFQLVISGSAIQTCVMELMLMDLASDTDVAEAIKADPPTISTLGAGTITSTSIADNALALAKFASDIKTGNNLNANVVAQNNIDFGALQKASLNAAVPQDSAGVTTLLARITASVALATELALVPKSTGSLSFNSSAMNAISDTVHDEIVAGTYTWRQLEKIFMSILVGALNIVDNGNGTHTYSFRDVANTKNRAVLIIDDDTGVRTVSSLDGV